MQPFPEESQLNLGEQPLAQILAAHNLKAQDIVFASTEQLTFKMIARAVKGRRLTPKMQFKILKAVNHATGKTFALVELFNY